MKEIKLNGKYSHIIVKVDDEDFEYLNQFSWSLSQTHNGICYARRFNGAKGKRNIFMHNEIMKPIKGNVTDHINRDGLDNRKINLRNCTHSQNAMNRASYKNTSSKYKGVFLHKTKYMTHSGIRYFLRWRVNIGINGKQVKFGLFLTEVEAALAYNKKAKELHGEFAHLNVVPPVRYYQKPMLIPII